MGVISYCFMAQTLLNLQELQCRGGVHYKLRLPVIFRWNDGGDQTEGGFTKEVSRHGALVVSRRCPPIGSDVRMDVLFPLPNWQCQGLWIECLGKVTRIEHGSRCCSFRICGRFTEDQVIDYAAESF